MTKMSYQEFTMAYRILRMHFDDMSDWMQCELHEPMAMIKEETALWKAGGKEPDWADYAEWFNQICIEDGMPALFVSDEVAA